MGIEKIKTAIKLGRSICVTGPAGTGKSYNVDLLCKAIDDGEIPGVFNYHKLATTGLAAMNIRGITLNSFFGIGIQSNPLWADEMERSDKWRFIKGKIAKTDLIIIDEVSMLRPDTFELLHRVAQKAKCSNEFFGGIQVIFVGDFLQLPPVIKEDEAEEIGCQWIFQHELWKDNVDTVMLNKIYRQSDHKTVNALNNIRMGECPEWVDDMMTGRVDATLVAKPLEIVSTNKQAEKINFSEVNKIESDCQYYKARIEADNDYMINTIKKQVTAEEVLELRVGARVMCLTNIKGGSIVNGSIGTVIKFISPEEDIEDDQVKGSKTRGGNNKNLPVVEFDNGEELIFGFHVWDIGKGAVEYCSERKKRIFKFKTVASFAQIPLKLAYAITIHKSQGMTLDNVSIDCERIFAGGQAYVALSRVRSIEGLRLTGWDSKYVHADSAAVEFYKSNGQELAG